MCTFLYTSGCTNSFTCNAYGLANNFTCANLVQREKVLKCMFHSINYLPSVENTLYKYKKKIPFKGLAKIIMTREMKIFTKTILSRGQD